MTEPGTLYVVATPIGNLEDLSPRARAILGKVDVIACEDTRVTGKLLHHCGIETRMVSYHEHNEAARSEELMARLEAGDDVALASDAGTPTISDPGYRLVRAARNRGVPVRPVPGPSALLAALAASGLPTSRFTFAGFVPPRGAARRRAIEELGNLSGSIVLFEAPTRIARLLEELSAAWGPRPASVSREMTKLHEEHRAGSLPELAAWARGLTDDGKRLRGELTIVVGPQEASRQEAVSIDALAPRFEELRQEGLSAREAAKRLAREHGLGARDVYNTLVKSRDQSPE